LNVGGLEHRAHMHTLLKTVYEDLSRTLMREEDTQELQTAKFCGDLKT